MTTSFGQPVAVRVLEGNTADQSTLMDQIKELRDDFGVKEMIFVGDRGMITHKRIEEITNGDYKWLDYITALKRSEMMSCVEDEHHPIQNVKARAFVRYGRPFKGSLLVILTYQVNRLNR